MSFNIIDVVALVVIGLAVYAEAGRGAIQALGDAARVVFGIGAGLLGWHLAFTLVGGTMAGLVGLLALGTGAVLLVNIVARRLFPDPHPGRGPLDRTIGGAVGLGLGLLVNLIIIPALAIGPAITPLVERSVVGHRFLDAVPGVYDAADLLDIRFPSIGSERNRFQSESPANGGAFVGRVNFRRYDRTTCIECGGRVRFDGYRRVKGTVIAPHFTCSSCGRVSCGCGSFEAFHALYRRCPYELSVRGTPLDCGVWPSGRPVSPEVECPVCGRGGER